MYLFTDDDISVRKMNNSIEDKTLLLDWLSNPELLELAYGEGAPWNMQKIEDKFAEKTTESGSAVACFIEYDKKAIGYIQYYTIEEDSYHFNEQVPFKRFKGGYGIDIFIGYPKLWGKGIGTKTVKAMKNYLMNTFETKVICADPEENNQRSMRCWIKAGFSPVDKVQDYDYPEKSDILMVVFQ